MAGVLQLQTESLCPIKASSALQCKLHCPLNACDAGSSRPVGDSGRRSRLDVNRVAVDGVALHAKAQARAHVPHAGAIQDVLKAASQIEKLEFLDLQGQAFSGTLPTQYNFPNLMELNLINNNIGVRLQIDEFSKSAQRKGFKRQQQRLKRACDTRDCVCMPIKPCSFGSAQSPSQLLLHCGLHGRSGK